MTGQPRHQGNLNPIRYRGYYYDTELEMYWLTTRFYDPQTGRFINADGQLNGGMLGNNLYAYCSNDPVNSCDCIGTCAHNTMSFDCSSCRIVADRDKLIPKVMVYTEYYWSYVSTAVWKQCVMASVIWYDSGKKTYEITTVFSEQNELSFDYKISSKGVIRFIFPDMTIKQSKYLVEYSWLLSYAMLQTGRFINPDFLQGRTDQGITLELLTHYDSYKMVTIDRLDTADMGSSIEGASGYDENACLFEEMASWGVFM